MKLSVSWCVYLRDEFEFDIYAHTNNGPFEFQLSGNEKSVPGDEVLQISKMSPRQKIEYRLNSPYIPDTARVFTGSIATQNRGKEYENNISCTSLDDRISGPLVKKEVHYIPSFGTFVSKIDWSKSDSLRELFRPFEHLGTEKIYAL